MENMPILHYGASVERLGWTMVVLGLLSQISAENALPSYNLILGSAILLSIDYQLPLPCRALVIIRSSSTEIQYNLWVIILLGSLFNPIYSISSYFY